MSFFKRLSRSRTNSQSYVEDYDSPNSPKYSSHRADSKYDGPPSSHQSYNNPSAHFDGQAVQSPTDPSLAKEVDMYQRQPGPRDSYGPPPGSRGNSMANGMAPGQTASGAPQMAAHSSFDTSANPSKMEPAPDLLTRAFNEAMRPYNDKIEQLENQLADLSSWVEQLELQQKEVHSWIDKRGLRPDVPPSIAKAMDAQPNSADTLNAQLDRKITIVNFDLHRLQDDLNDSISASHFASAMAKFLPDIDRLSSLQGGSRFAFDLILKLGGNLNSHGGLDSGNPDDLAARRAFYANLDDSMVEVVRRRFNEGEDWPVTREIKRIEKTGAYLKNYGVEPYFPNTLEVMKRSMHYQNGQGTPPSYN
ncbi:MAG: hypothetical protein M1820_008582 [Bogoriella megaspora]|nr:MAG: hypothetical protein M1820_008582 [Bogoriella megaspora]